MANTKFIEEMKDMLRAKGFEISTDLKFGLFAKIENERQDMHIALSQVTIYERSNKYNLSIRNWISNNCGRGSDFEKIGKRKVLEIIKEKC